MVINLVSVLLIVPMACARYSKPAAVPFYQHNLIGFDGEYTDFLTEWKFLVIMHRTYNPKLRNFVSEDPAVDGYTFFSNNLVMKTDLDVNMPK